MCVEEDIYLTPYMRECFKLLKVNDNELYMSIENEILRQQKNIELIASENIVSEDILAATGSIFTNKYAEGYPYKRYYGGCHFIDEVENLAIERGKKLFHAESVNVQPHSGTQANFAVYFAVLSPGDTVMGMALSEGGHLTHGSKVNISGKYYNFVPYGVDHKTGLIDYNQIQEIAFKCKPKMIVCGASAYPRHIDFSKFKEIADSVGSLLMVDMAHIAGLVAAGLHQNPVPYADFVTTTTHKTLRGPRGGAIFCKKIFEEKINKSVFPGIQGGPLEHVIAAKALCFKKASSDEFRTYMKSVLDNCSVMANELKNLGMEIVSGGTDNHLFLVDLSGTEVTGKDLESKLDNVNITVNKNTVPGEKRSPQLTSGLRIGTAVITSRGMSSDDCKNIANLIFLVYKDFEKNLKYVKDEVKKIVKKYPIYSGFNRLPIT